MIYTHLKLPVCLLEAAEGDANGPQVEGSSRPLTSPARKKRKGSSSNKIQVRLSAREPGFNICIHVYAYMINLNERYRKELFFFLV